MKRLLILISGSGTNMQAVIDAVAAGELNAEIVGVISSNPDAAGLNKAEKAGIKTYVCRLKDYESREARDAEILRIADSLKTDVIVLAGYLGILTSELIRRYRNRIINIHPALLPKYGGAGFYGLNVHKAVIAAGEKTSGATVHYVDEGTDTGEIILQRATEVLPTDTPETLQKRILDNIEHRLIVDALRILCNGEKL